MKQGLRFAGISPGDFLHKEQADGLIKRLPVNVLIFQILN
jgi:hypothetical protein